MYIPDSFVIMLIMMALFIFPTMLGCMITLLILIGVVYLIFFSFLHFIWILSIIVCFYLFKLIKVYMYYYKIPTLDAYIAQYPYTQISNKVQCYKCSSTDSVNLGFLNNRSCNRYYVCKNCSLPLFRFKVLECLK